MKILDRAEIEGLSESGINVRDLVLSLNTYSGFLQTILLLKTDITVNEMRVIMDLGPHPNPVKGAMYLWEDEPSD